MFLFVQQNLCTIPNIFFKERNRLTQTLISDNVSIPVILSLTRMASDFRLTVFHGILGNMGQCKGSSGTPGNDTLSSFAKFFHERRWYSSRSCNLTLDPRELRGSGWNVGYLVKVCHGNSTKMKGKIGSMYLNYV